jgi:hypothetical protein
MPTLLAQVDRSGSEPAELVQCVLQNPGLLPEVMAGLEAAQARIKYRCVKILRRIGEQQPALLYTHFDFFVRLLDSDNQIFQWNAAIILSHLVRVDADRKFEAIFAKYFSPVTGPVMITAANIIGGAARIAAARPDWADRVAREILKVAHARYQTAECRRVAMGHAIQAYDLMWSLLQDKKPVWEFVRQQRRNRRPATRAKAERFLRRHVIK